jgi:hypothetical protein
MRESGDFRPSSDHKSSTSFLSSLSIAIDEYSAAGSFYVCDSTETEAETAGAPELIARQGALEVGTS